MLFNTETKAICWRSLEGSTSIWKEYLPTNYDSLLIVYRKWRARVAYSVPYLADVDSSAEIPRTSINDRYKHHVKSCGVCSGASKTTRITRITAYILLGIAGALNNGTLGYNQGSLKGVSIAAVLTIIVMVAPLRLIAFVINLMTYTELSYERKKWNVFVESDSEKRSACRKLSHDTSSDRFSPFLLMVCLSVRARHASKPWNLPFLVQSHITILHHFRCSMMLSGSWLAVIDDCSALIPNGVTLDKKLIKQYSAVPVLGSCMFSANQMFLF